MGEGEATVGSAAGEGKQQQEKQLWEWKDSVPG